MYCCCVGACLICALGVRVGCVLCVCFCVYIFGLIVSVCVLYVRCVCALGVYRTCVSAAFFLACVYVLLLC